MSTPGCPAGWSQPHWRILCYHTIPDSLTGAFRAQLTAFREMGFWFTDFDQGLKLCQGEGFTRPTMTVTFDDAYLTVYKNALPILEELGIKGFHYLIVDYVNKGSTYRAENPLPAMTWDHVRDWVGRGHGVGSHTFTHAHLEACSDSCLIDECVRSRQVLEEKLQVPICHFSYPCGFHSRRTYRLIRAGRLYDSVATIDRGRMWAGHDPYKLRRDVCDPRWSLESVLRVMRLADRWYWLRHFRRYWQRHLCQGRGRRIGRTGCFG
jgi:peptidoglycan/xylan/chitin deacetylase (PgdA/CDA1 family)